MKILVNRCYGGFNISDEAFEEYLNRTGQVFYKRKSKWSSLDSLDSFDYYKVSPEEYDKIYQEETTNKVSSDGHIQSNELYLTSSDISRTDPILIQIVEEMGEKSFGMCSEIEVVNIPDDIKYTIEEYDGNEHIAEAHRTW